MGWNLEQTLFRPTFIHVKNFYLLERLILLFGFSNTHK